MDNFQSISNGSRAWKPLLVFAIFTFTITLVGYFIFQHYKQDLKIDEQRNLGEIAALKIGQITHWIAEHKDNAQALSSDPLFLSEVEHWLQQSDKPSESRTKLAARLTALLQAYEVHGYTSISLFDNQGTLRLSTAADNALNKEHEKQRALESIRSGKIFFSDIHVAKRGSGNVIELDLVSPLFVGKDKHTIGAVLFHIDPARFLFPLIQRWPIYSSSAENLLVSIEGNEVVFLNELRHVKNTPLAMRLPFSQQQFLAVKAARGEEGLSEGVDYRGALVVGVLSKVPGTPWLLISKIDKAEIYARINHLAYWVAAMMLTLVGSCGAIILVWQRKERRHFENELKNRLLEKRLDYLAKYANDIILLHDSAGNIVDFNDRALAAYGYSQAELSRMNMNSLRHSESNPSFAERRDKIKAAGALLFESIHVRSNGEHFPVESSVRLIEIDGEEFYQAIIRDITKRKMFNEMLYFHSKILTSLAEGIVLVQSDNQKIVFTNEPFERMFGYANGELMGKLVSVLNAPGDDSQEEIARKIKAKLDREGVWNGEVHNIRKDGTTFWCHASVSTFDHPRFGKVWVSVHEDITERKRADEVLKKQQERFRVLFDRASEGILILSTSGKVVEVNQAFAGARGYTPDEMKLMNIRELDTPESYALAPERMRRILAEGSLTFEVEHYHKDGHVIPFETTSSAVVIEGKTFFQAFSHDITERKQADEILASYKRGIENSSDGFWMTDMSGNILESNAAYARLSGYTVEELVNMHISQLEAIEQTPDIQEHIAKIEALGYDRFETRHRHKDGHGIDIEVSATYMAESGKLFVFCQDITERKLRDLEMQKFEAIIDSTDDAIISKSTSGIIQSWNSGAEIIFGYTAAEVLGKSIKILIPEDNRDEEDVILSRINSGERIRHYETVRLRKDGSLINISATVSPIFSGQGRVVGASKIVRDITERRRAEQALRKSQSNLIAAQKIAKFGSWERNLLDNTVTWSDETYNLYEIDKNEAGDLRKKFLNQIHPVDRLKIAQALSDTIDKGKKYDIEYRVTLASGKQKFFHALADVIRDTEGNAVVMQGTVQDITERKQTESTLRKLSQAVEQNLVSVMITDLDANIEYVNQAFVKETGYSFEEVAGKNPRMLSSGMTPHSVYRELWASLLKGEAWKGELINRHKDGSVYTSYSLVSPVRDTEGRISNYLAVREDVSERKRNIAEIKRMNCAHRLLSRENELIARATDRDPLFNALCCATVESMLFRFAWIGMLDEQRSQVIPVAYAGVEKGYIDYLNIRLDDEHTGNGPTGRAIRMSIPTFCQNIQDDTLMLPWREEALKRGYFSSAAFPLFEAGRVVGAITVYATEADFFSTEISELLLELSYNLSFALDVFAERTRRSLAEIEIMQLNAELEKRVEERTRQLEDANHELESFSYSVSHDLRAPLRSIDGFSQILLKKYHGQLDAQGQNYLGRLRRASQHMGQLIDDLLVLSKVTRGTLKLKRIDLSSIAKKVADELCKLNPQRIVKFTVQPELSAYADPGLMSIVIDNLLGNAWKYTSKKPAAKIKFGARDVNGETVFFVCDNGDGFNMNFAHKLFGAFQRLHATHEFEGTGIGLATVQRIIRRHNGKVWAEATEGEGATFYFTLSQKMIDN